MFAALILAFLIQNETKSVIWHITDNKLNRLNLLLQIMANSAVWGWQKRLDNKLESEIKSWEDLSNLNRVIKVYFKLHCFLKGLQTVSTQNPPMFNIIKWSFGKVQGWDRLQNTKNRCSLKCFKIYIIPHSIFINSYNTVLLSE